MKKKMMEKIMIYLCTYDTSTRETPVNKVEPIYRTDIIITVAYANLQKLDTSINPQPTADFFFLNLLLSHETVLHVCS